MKWLQEILVPLLCKNAFGFSQGFISQCTAILDVKDDFTSLDVGRYRRRPTRLSLIVLLVFGLVDTLVTLKIDKEHLSSPNAGKVVINTTIQGRLAEGRARTLFVFQHQPSLIRIHHSQNVVRTLVTDKKPSKRFWLWFPDFSNMSVGLSTSPTRSDACFSNRAYSRPCMAFTKVTPFNFFTPSSFASSSNWFKAKIRASLPGRSPYPRTPREHEQSTCQ